MSILSPSPPAPDPQSRRALLFEAMRDLRLSVVVPVFNEGVNLKAKVALLMKEVSPYFRSCEFLLVNDGSTDGSQAVLRSLDFPNVRIIGYDRNSGKGFAVREGFKAATGDYVLFIDGGMELHPRDIKVFLGLMQLYDCDIVMGSKRHPQSQVDYPWSRRLLSFIFQSIVRLIFKVNVTDTQVGLKLLKREVVDAILPYLTIDRYGFDLEMLVLARRKGFRRFLEAPIRLDYFNHNRRSFVREYLHIFRVGLSILKDTWRIYQRLKDVPSGEPEKHTSKGEAA